MCRWVTVMWQMTVHVQIAHALTHAHSELDRIITRSDSCTQEETTRRETSITISTQFHPFAVHRCCTPSMNSSARPRSTSILVTASRVATVERSYIVYLVTLSTHDVDLLIVRIRLSAFD